LLEACTQPHGYLRRWCRWAEQSALPRMIRVAQTIRSHWDCILRWFKSHTRSALLEGFNSLIKTTKAMARGYQNVENLITISYLNRRSATLQCFDSSLFVVGS
jgi:transposase